MCRARGDFPRFRSNLVSVLIRREAFLKGFLHTWSILLHVSFHWLSPVWTMYTSSQRLPLLFLFIVFVRFFLLISPIVIKLLKSCSNSFLFRGFFLEFYLLCVWVSIIESRLKKNCLCVTKFEKAIGYFVYMFSKWNCDKLYEINVRRNHILR